MPQKVQGSKSHLGVEMVAVQHEADGRARILTAARTLFSANGFHQTSMAQLASAAQVSVGQIYRLFKGKEEVIEALVEAGEPIGPKDLAAMTGQNYGTVRSMCYRLSRGGVIRKHGRGLYTTND